MKEKGKHLKNFLAGLIVNNPLFVMILGVCPALGVTTSFEAALGMGILFTLVLLCSNVLISLLRKIIPEEIKTPCYIIVIATFVTIVKMLAEAYLPSLYSSLGTFLSLIVVNCVVLGRAESFASKNGVGDAALDGLGNGLGFTLAICLIGLIREILGKGYIAFGEVLEMLPHIKLMILVHDGVDLSMPLFSSPAGGFIVLGLILAVLQSIKLHREKKKKEMLKKGVAK